MVVFHLIDESGVHWVFPDSAVVWVTGNVIDGSQQFTLRVRDLDRTFSLSLGQFQKLTQALSPTGLTALT